MDLVRRTRNEAYTSAKSFLERCYCIWQNNGAAIDMYAGRMKEVEILRVVDGEGSEERSACIISPCPKTNGTCACVLGHKAHIGFAGSQCCTERKLCKFSCLVPRRLFSMKSQITYSNLGGLWRMWLGFPH